MELERKYVTLSKQKGHAVSQVTLEEDLNVPDQKPDIFRSFTDRENSARTRSKVRPGR